jgi:hypothetical protein
MRHADRAPCICLPLGGTKISVGDSTSASYLGGPCFKSQTGDRPTEWFFSCFSPVPPRKYRDSTTSQATVASYELYKTLFINHSMIGVEWSVEYVVKGTKNKEINNTNWRGRTDVPSYFIRIDDITFLACVQSKYNTDLKFSFNWKHYLNALGVHGWIADCGWRSESGGSSLPLDSPTPAS